ncbi:g13095 [Coccomyxa viridis]|uniref:G13095 protein n=1 Tax=Coccomyxa viridis TaxID=1274662 RepID=A0ABP1GGM6_9CHLO
MTTTEEAAGIVCYTTDTTPFSAILKHRFSDFLVNEIDASGRVVRLTSLDASSSVVQQSSVQPKLPAIPESAETADEKPPAQTSAGAAEAPDTSSSVTETYPSKPDWEETVKGFADVLPAESYSAVLSFYQTIAAFEAARSGTLPNPEDGSEREYVRPPKPLSVPVSADKAERTRVHELCRHPKLPKVTTQTIQEDPERPLIELSFHYKRSNKRKRAENGQAQSGNTDNSWPVDSAHKFCRFVLYKENMDSSHALGCIARLLHIQQSSLSVAGTKDKRAVTVQHVTAFKVTPGRLAQLNRCMRGIRVGNFEPVQEQLHLGDALGNRFEITLRDVVAPTLQAVADAAEALRSKGFVNYFGLQRFGAGVNATHHVGRELIKGNWKEAVRLLMSGHEGERADSAQARKLFLEDEDIAGALKQMPRHQTVERAILEGLRRQAGNYAHALHQVPRNSRHLYVHAYQSFLWNTAATHRVQTFGIDAAVAGDLIIPSGTTCGDADGENGVVAETSDKRTTGHLATVHVVSEEEAAAGMYSIDDVVLPLPGSCISYPEHATAQIYRDTAERDGISLDTAPHGDKDFSLLGMPGSYRRVTHPYWRLLSYKEADEALAITDLQRLEHASLASVIPIDTGKILFSSSTWQTSAIQSEVAEGAKVALQLIFKLPGACYATMLVRELTKTSTATAVHKKLTQQLPDAKTA